jgi:hypothetical protein
MCVSNMDGWMALEKDTHGCGGWLVVAAAVHSSNRSTVVQHSLFVDYCHVGKGTYLYIVYFSSFGERKDAPLTAHHDSHLEIGVRPLFTSVCEQPDPKL